MPAVQIAGIFGVSEKTIQRDLNVVLVPEAMTLVRDRHAVPFSTMASLVAKAKKDKNADQRLKDLFKAIGDFATNAEEEFKNENAERVASGDPELSQEDRQPQKKLTKARIAVWENALDTGKSFDQQETIQFSASAKDEDGVPTIKVTAINTKVGRLSFDDVQTIYARITKFRLDLQKILRDKAAQERQGTGSNEEAVRSQLAAEYAALGIADLIQPDEPETDGDDAEDFDKTEERQETDALADNDAAGEESAE